MQYLGLDKFVVILHKLSHYPIQWINLTSDQNIKNSTNIHFYVFIWFSYYFLWSQIPHQVWMILFMPTSMPMSQRDFSYRINTVTEREKLPIHWQISQINVLQNWGKMAIKSHFQNEMLGGKMLTWDETKGYFKHNICSSNFSGG